MSNTQALDAIVQSDLEWSGSINRSTAQGEKFALLIAMLSDNVLLRPAIEKTEPDESYNLDVQNHYRRNPLSAEQVDWEKMNHANFAFHNNVSDGRLWCVLNPQPLAMFDDDKRLDAEIIANCSHVTQQRYKAASDNTIEVDETILYDVLESIHA